jgi:diguanylate cyclase (GGDEF)-like protein
VNLLDDETIDGIVATAVDITSLVAARERLHHLATHDELTGLLNRSAFRDRLNDALTATRAHHVPVSALFCDVDGFKAVNDRLGHRAGDEVLAEIAARLRSAVRETDLVARYGGDEFVLAFVADDPRTTKCVLDRVQLLLDAPIVLSTGTEITVRTSTGCAIDDGHGDIDDLLAAADAAMYAAKQQPDTQ